jgi:hypothetical protein
MILFNANCDKSIGNINVRHLVELPTFNSTQLEVINKVKGDIYKYLDKPTDYYISMVQITDGLVIVYLGRIIDLQSYAIEIRDGGKVKTLKIASRPEDKNRPFKFYFTKHYSLVYCEKIGGDFCDNVPVLLRVQ